MEYLGQNIPFKAVKDKVLNLQDWNKTSAKILREEWEMSRGVVSPPDGTSEASIGGILNFFRFSFYI